MEGRSILIVFFVDTYKRLTNIMRCNTVPRLNQESVATHSYFVVVLSMLVADFFVSKGEKIDKQKICELAMVHDWEECFSGDITAAIKYHEKEFAQQLELVNIRAIEYVTKSLKLLQPYWVRVWHEARKKESIESKIVAGCDYICSAVWALIELEMGNKNVLHIFENGIKTAIERCPMLEPIAMELVARSGIAISFDSPAFHGEKIEDTAKYND